LMRLLFLRPGMSTHRSRAATATKPARVQVAAAAHDRVAAIAGDIARATIAPKSGSDGSAPARLSEPTSRKFSTLAFAGLSTASSPSTRAIRSTCCERWRSLRQRRHRRRRPWPTATWPSAVVDDDDRILTRRSTGPRGGPGCARGGDGSRADGAICTVDNGTRRCPTRRHLVTSQRGSGGAEVDHVAGVDAMSDRAVVEHHETSVTLDIRSPGR